MPPKSSKPKAGEASSHCKKPRQNAVRHKVESDSEDSVLIQDILGPAPEKESPVCETCAEGEHNCSEALGEEPKNLLEYAYHRGILVEHYKGHGWKATNADVDRYHGVDVGTKDKYQYPSYPQNYGPLNNAPSVQPYTQGNGYMAQPAYDNSNATRSVVPQRRYVPTGQFITASMPPLPRDNCPPRARDRSLQFRQSNGFTISLKNFGVGEDAWLV
ncbi:hypothetical protein DM02DRAFT_661714 [Periconia macrospinosa]|uniref:Uncharacterized protein n=1 Tax=Periconia macrospinosa TaxID=97972 RepID=A0A2V1D6M8_9PLEO|nr:hypothetical protein DM02DRAFT_661714 [Periconia macrospinosa]